MTKKTITEAYFLFNKIRFDPIAHTLPNLVRCVSFLILSSFGYSKDIFNNKKKQLLRLIFFIKSDLAIEFRINGIGTRRMKHTSN